MLLLLFNVSVQQLIGIATLQPSALLSTFLQAIWKNKRRKPLDNKRRKEFVKAQKNVVE